MTKEGVDGIIGDLHEAFSGVCMKYISKNINIEFLIYLRLFPPASENIDTATEGT